MNKQIYVSVVVGICCLPQMLFAVTVYNPNYQVETYVQYNYESLGRARNFTLDSNGNIYVTHSFDEPTRTGSVQKIDTAKTISPLRTDLVNPRHITWGGGTAFGDYLYVTDPAENNTWSNGEVTRIDLSGSKTSFCGGLSQPSPLGIDTTGNYNNLLYIGNSVDDKILSVGVSGGTATTFSNYPYGVSGSPSGIGFDTTGNYGNSMFVSTVSSDASVSGLFKIDTNGDESRYTDLTYAAKFAIDDTIQQDFNGKMFVNGKYNSVDSYDLYMINGYNDQELFGTFNLSPNYLHSAIEFGPDGALYAMECDTPNNTVIISRITPVPEPATLILLGLGGLVIRKRK